MRILYILVDPPRFYDFVSDTKLYQRMFDTVYLFVTSTMDAPETAYDGLTIRNAVDQAMNPSAGGTQHYRFSNQVN